MRYPFLRALGHPKHVGPTGAGQLAKLANQMIVGATIGVVAEALLLCERGGANMAKVREAITGGFADSRILQVHGHAWWIGTSCHGDACPSSSKTCAMPWPRHGKLGSKRPSPRLFEQLYADGVQHGLADLSTMRACSWNWPAATAWCERRTGRAAQYCLKRS